MVKQHTCGRIFSMVSQKSLRFFPAFAGLVCNATFVAVAFSPFRGKDKNGPAISINVPNSRRRTLAPDDGYPAAAACSSVAERITKKQRKTCRS